MTLKALSKACSLTLALALLGAAGATYTVQKGDTLYSIARKNHLTVEQLLSLNNLSSPEISIGQVLRLSSKEPLPKLSVDAAIQTAAPATAPKTDPKTDYPASPTTPKSDSPSAAPSTGSLKVGAVTVKIPTRLKGGQAFSVVLSGEGAAAATVRFPSELAENVRRPNEMLTPYGAADIYTVPGRVVLGQSKPVLVEIKVGDNTERRSIPVTPEAKNAVQHLNLPPATSQKLKDPGKEAEDALVNTNYERRTQPQWTRPFAQPLDKLTVTSSFGSARTYTAGGPVVYHYGADYPAKTGTPIHAVNDGTVVIAGNYPVRGGFVMIDHGGGISSLYFHQSKVTAKVGQVLRRGDTIGLVGATGLAAGAHLHLEIRVRGEATNPSDWFGKLWP